MVNILIQKSQGVFVTETVHRMCITYVCNSVEMSPTYKVLKPHMEFLLFGVIFPTLSLSQADIRSVPFLCECLWDSCTWNLARFLT